MWYALHVRSKRGRREMSMKRYTNRLDDGQAIMNCQDCDTDWTNKHAPKCTVMYCRNRLKDRVAAYEDTGLEPQEIEKIRKDIEAGFLEQAARKYGIDIDRIRELVEADRDGRCVIYLKGFPVASTYLQEGGLYIRETSGVIIQEEYKAALKGERDG